MCRVSADYSFLHYKCVCPFCTATEQSAGFELLYLVVEPRQFITACRRYRIPALAPVATYTPLRYVAWYLGKESLVFTIRMSTRSAHVEGGA
jgi:hypothetical protein